MQIHAIKIFTQSAMLHEHKHTFLIPPIGPKLPRMLQIWKHTTLYPQIHMKLHITPIHITTLKYSIIPPSSRIQTKPTPYPFIIHTPTHSSARLGHTTNSLSHTLALTPRDMCSRLLKSTKRNACNQTVCPECTEDPSVTDDDIKMSTLKIK